MEVGQERDVYALELYYPKRGLSFEISPLGMAIFPDQPDMAQISAYMRVEAIQYYQSGDFRDIHGITLTRQDVEKYL